MQQVLFWNAPILIFLCVIAEPLFRFLLTDKWMPAVPYFKILCICGIMYPLHAYNLNILKVLGKSALFLKLEVVKKVLSLIGILSFISFGIYGLLYFQLFFNFVAYYINSIYSGKLIAYPVREQVEDILPILILAGSIGVACYFLDMLLAQLFIPDLIRIAIIGICYALLYYAFSLLIKLTAINDFKQLILRK